MKKWFLFASTISIIFFVSQGCSPHLHLDFLGKDEITEVTLVDSRAREKILLLDISGIIGTNLKPGLLEREGDLLSQVYHRLEKASRDKMVRGVILRLDSPGGEVTASDILYNEIVKFKEKTGIPVVALTMGVAASGAYYIASACDHIVAHPSTITGSIGVIAVFPHVDELLQKIGVGIQVLKSGEMKDSGSTFRSLTDEEKELFQDVINEMYERFLDVVLEGRRGALTGEDLRKIADGRIYTARRALQLKLIDEVGYFEAALKKSLSLASLREAKVVSYTYYPKRKTNIYAQGIAPSDPFAVESLKDVLPKLKTGFYYIWLPGLFDF